MATSDLPPARILVVDDNPGTLYATGRTLKAGGFAVAQASTGNGAIEYTNDQTVDLIVLDVNLPDMDGFTVCRKIRENPTLFRVPVIYLSASFVTDLDKVQGFEAGADGYLTHPVDPTVLNATVKALLRTRVVEAEREESLIRERAARDEAEQANRAKDQFLATLSHELRSPLNAIIGWTEVLKMQPALAPEVMNAINVIARNARFQAQLISDLLDVSRITSGKLQMDVQPVDVNELLESAYEVVLPAAQARHMTIDQAIDPHIGPLHGDRARLQQIITNLVGNAIKFSNEGSTIRVSARRVDSVAELIVSDHGVGISSDDLPRIFDRFWQQDTSSRRAHSGLGLGLAIVKSLTEMHGGTVRAESEGAGTGATFTVRLPVGPSTMPRNITPTSAAIARSNLPDDRPRLDGVRILLVDDDPDARMWVRKVVVKLGAEVEDAGDVAQALATLERFEPQVLISDLAMPRQDGFDLVRLLRARGLDASQLPAIALSAFASAEDRAKALDAGYQIFLSKPPEPAELLHAVQQLTQTPASRA